MSSILDAYIELYNENQRLKQERKMLSTSLFKVFLRKANTAKRLMKEKYFPGKGDHVTSDPENQDMAYRFVQYKEEIRNRYGFDPKRLELPVEKGLVSVVLPVYNGEDYVKLSIESVLSQSYHNLELIIVNDGSTDGTKDIIASFLKDDRVVCIEQTNQKLPRALTNGFKAAKGEFLTWTSADNIMEKDNIALLVNELTQHPEADFVFSNMSYIDENGDPLTDYNWYSEAGSDVVSLPHDDLGLNTFKSNFIGAAFMYRYYVWHVLGAYSTQRFGVEDYDYWMKVNDLFTIRHTDYDEPHYFFRIHKGSLTSHAKELRIEEQLNRLMMFEEFRRDYLLCPCSWKIEKTSEDDISAVIQCIEKRNESFAYTEGPEKDELSGLPYAIRIAADGKSIQYDGSSYPAEAESIDNVLSMIEFKGKLDHLRYLESKAQTSAQISAQTKAQISAQTSAETSAQTNAQTNAQTGSKRFAASVIVVYHGQTAAIESIRKWHARENVELIVAHWQGYPYPDQLDGEYLQEIVCDRNDDVIIRNQAIWSTGSDCLIFLEEDCIIEHDTIQTMLDAFKIDERIGVVIGSTIDEAEDRDPSGKAINRDPSGKAFAAAPGTAVTRDPSGPAQAGASAMDHDHLYLEDDSSLPALYCNAFRTDAVRYAGGLLHMEKNDKQQGGDRSISGLAIRFKNAGYYIYCSKDAYVKRRISGVEA